MRILIVEDDEYSARLLSRNLSEYGECDIAVDGSAGVEAVRVALAQSRPYSLICLDIMMPNLDGQSALKQIRELEADAGYQLGSGARIVMVTSLSDSENVLKSFEGKSDGYLVKPIDVEQLDELLQRLNLA